MAVKLYYEKYGTGLPVVCIHGYPLDHSIWKPLVSYLETKTQVILPDLRGHGKSPAPAGPYTMQEMAEDILDLIDTLGFSQVLMVGQSMGGYIALQFARFYPERLLGLVLVASHPYPDDPEKKKKRYDTIQKVKEEGVVKALEEFPLCLSSVPEIQEYTRKIINSTCTTGVMGSLQAMAERIDHSDILSNAEYPTAVILGQQDSFVPQAQIKQMQAQFPKTKFSVLENTGHMLMMEEPQAVSALLLEIVNQIEEKD
ncbi:MAG: alpha/beta fold hydrolase [Anaerolineaceae bacterium]